MPKPFVSRFRPTFMVSQGSRALTYSFFGDSTSNAYFPFDVLTRRMPSSYVFTKTCFREFMYSHILLCKPIWDLCKWQKKKTHKYKYINYFSYFGTLSALNASMLVYARIHTHTHTHNKHAARERQSEIKGKENWGGRHIHKHKYTQILFWTWECVHEVFFIQVHEFKGLVYRCECLRISSCMWVGEYACLCLCVLKAKTLYFCSCCCWLLFLSCWA